MKTFVSYILALAVVAGIVIALGKFSSFAPGPQGKPHNIYISGCDTRDEPKGHKSESIAFHTDIIYHVKFSTADSPSQGTKYPFTRNDSQADNEFDIIPGAANEHQLTGPNDCSQRGCYYRYTLKRIINGVPEGTLCNDPGIHIIQ